jgi:hypothetical protein
MADETANERLSTYDEIIDLLDACSCRQGGEPGTRMNSQVRE